MRSKGCGPWGNWARRIRIHPTVIVQWKRQLMERGAEVFSRNGSRSGRSEEELTGPLYEEIGRLKMEIDWLKKKL